MSEKKPKLKEEELYFPILNMLKEMFDRFYVAESYVYARNGLQKAPTSGITNPHLIITAHGDFSEELQRVFDTDLFAALYAEKLKPDIMGFVRKKESDKPEIITVEVKAGELKIRDVLQAKMYSDIFKATFAFIISPKGISIPKLRTIMKHDKELRGNVLIASYDPFDQWKPFRIYEELKPFVPKELQFFCR
jgi:hypothetical protein